MKNLLWSFLFLTLFFFTACEKESTIDELPLSEIHDNNTVTTRSSDLIDICHYDEDNDTWHVISINENAVSAHQAHGDAVDMDGDGYFDIPNGCSETDCDDTNAAINPGSPEICDNNMDDDCDGDVDGADSDCDGCSTEGLLSVEVNTGQETYTIYLNAMDDNSGIQWSPDFTLLSATDDWDGQGNTSTIVDHYDGQNVDKNTYAAGICAELAATTGCEWYLPAKEELNAMYEKFGPGGTSGNNEMPEGTYWSSTEVTYIIAWGHFFDLGDQFNINKSFSGSCRCVRR